MWKHQHKRYSPMVHLWDKHRHYPNQHKNTQSMCNEKEYQSLCLWKNSDQYRKLKYNTEWSKETSIRIFMSLLGQVRCKIKSQH